MTSIVIDVARGVRSERGRRRKDPCSIHRRRGKHRPGGIKPGKTRKAGEPPINDLGSFKGAWTPCNVSGSAYAGNAADEAGAAYVAVAAIAHHTRGGPDVAGAADVAWRVLEAGRCCLRASVAYEAWHVLRT